MLMNSSNTGKERKETRYFHWLEKNGFRQITKKKITQEEEIVKFPFRIYI